MSYGGGELLLKRRHRFVVGFVLYELCELRDILECGLVVGQAGSGGG